MIKGLIFNGDPARDNEVEAISGVAFMENDVTGVESNPHCVIREDLKVVVIESAQEWMLAHLVKRHDFCAHKPKVEEKSTASTCALGKNCLFLRRPTDSSYSR